MNTKVLFSCIAGYGYYVFTCWENCNCDQIEQQMKCIWNNIIYFNVVNKNFVSTIYFMFIVLSLDICIKLHYDIIYDMFFILYLKEIRNAYGVETLEKN